MTHFRTSPKRRNEHPEYDLQCTVAAYLHLAVSADIFWTSIPGGALAGGKENMQRQVRLNKSGYRSGAPDLVFVYKGRSIFIEMKAPSPEGHKPKEAAKHQSDIHKMIVLSGGVVTVCDSVEKVTAFLKACGLPLREVKMTDVHTGDKYVGWMKPKPSVKKLKIGRELFRP